MEIILFLIVHTLSSTNTHFLTLTMLTFLLRQQSRGSPAGKPRLFSSIHARTLIDRISQLSPLPHDKAQPAFMPLKFKLPMDLAWNFYSSVHVYAPIIFALMNDYCVFCYKCVLFANLFFLH